MAPESLEPDGEEGAHCQECQVLTAPQVAQLVHGAALGLHSHLTAVSQAASFESKGISTQRKKKKKKLFSYHNRENHWYSVFFLNDRKAF